MYAYVVYKDGARAVVSEKLVKNFQPSSDKDVSCGKNKDIYWRERNGETVLEDFFPGDVVELAETKKDLQRKLLKRRIRWPDDVFVDILNPYAPSKAGLSHKEKKKRKDTARHERMVALSSDYMVPHEPTKDGVQEQLQNEIISLRRKLAEEHKRNHELQEIVKKMLQGKHCTCACANQQQKEQRLSAEDVGEFDEPWWHEDGGSPTHSPSSTIQHPQDKALPAVPLPVAPQAVAPQAAAPQATVPQAAVSLAAVRPSAVPPTAAVPPAAMPPAAAVPPPDMPPAAAVPPPDMPPTAVVPPPAMPPAAAVPPQVVPPASTSDAEATQVNLGGDIYVPALKWQHLMGQPKDSLFVREAAKVIWGVKNLYNRSITGAPCRRYLYKEGGPFGGATEKRALTPTKMDALRSAYEEHLRRHPSDVPEVQRRRNMNRYLGDLLKVLKN